MLTIPATVNVGKYTFEPGNGIIVPIPGHSGWSWSTERKGQFISHGWHKDGQIVHADIFNAGISPYYALLECEGQDEPYMLDSQSGFGWTDDAWLVSNAVVELNPWDAKFDTWNDVDVTKDTGSSGMSIYSPPEMLAERYGVSAAVLRFYDRYRLKQVRRPRWWLDGLGLPVGLQNTKLKLSAFNEWAENVQGLNAYDLQHFDGYELYTGYMITGDPSYLFSMINLWTHAEANGWYIQKTPDQIYGGSIRTPGWYLVLSCQLYRMLTARAGFSVLAERVKETISWHLDNIVSKFPMSSPWYYGSIPNIFKEKKSNYIFGWQYAVVAHSCLWVSDTFEEIDPLMAEKAKMHARQIVTYTSAHSDTGPDPVDPTKGWIGYIWSPQDDPELHIKGLPPGVNHWNLGPLMRFEAEEFPIKTSLIADLKAKGWTKETHKYFTFSANVIGKEIWDL